MATKPDLLKYNTTHTPYFNSEGVQVPSVTTVLKILNKESLKKWANIMGFKRRKIEDILEESSVIGTAVHTIIYAFMMKKHYIWTSPRLHKSFILRYLNSFISWKQKHEVEPIFMEKQLVSQLFGGTVDFYGLVDGKKTIMDFKTSKGCYSSMFLQLAAYCMMLEELGYEVEQVAIINVHEKGTKEKFIDRTELERYIKVFKVLIVLFHEWYDLNEELGWGSVL